VWASAVVVTTRAAVPLGEGVPCPDGTLDAPVVGVWPPAVVVAELLLDVEPVVDGFVEVGVCDGVVVTGMHVGTTAALSPGSPVGHGGHVATAVSSLPVCAAHGFGGATHPVGTVGIIEGSNCELSAVGGCAERRPIRSAVVVGHGSTVGTATAS
jgi:hypothetical protein